MTLSGHSEGISSTVWLDEATVCSASWDHSIRVWDLHQASVVSTIVSHHFKPHTINKSRQFQCVKFTTFQLWHHLNHHNAGDVWLLKHREAITRTIVFLQQYEAAASRVITGRWAGEWTAIATRRSNKKVHQSVVLCEMRIACCNHFSPRNECRSQQ